MDRFRSSSEHPAPCGEGSAVKAYTLTRWRSSGQTSREIAGKTHTFLIWLALGRRMAGGRDSVKQHFLSYSLTYIVNGVFRVFHFACVKLILLEVDEVLVRWISLCLASNFWRKKLYMGKGRDFFCGISRTPSSCKPSVKSSLSSESSLQKVLQYRRRRQRIQSGSTASANTCTHDELSADKKSRVIQAGLPQWLLAWTNSKTAKKKKQSVWTSSVSHGKSLAPWPRSLLFNWPWPSTSLFFPSSDDRKALQPVRCALCRWYLWLPLPSMLSSFQNV